MVPQFIYDCGHQTSNKRMSSGSKTNSTAAERCHNCRRRRLRCDGTVPSCKKCIKAGQECLGYGKLFRWNQGIASRGKMMGKSFEVPAQPEVSAKESVSESSLVPVSKNGTLGHEAQSLIWTPSTIPGKNSPEISISPCLLDPLLQDLSSSSRYYISHCKYTESRPRFLQTC